MSLTFDNFMDLSVSIPKSRGFGSVNVDDLMKGFVKPEQMERCGYKCSKCKGIDTVEK